MGIIPLEKPLGRDATREEIIADLKKIETQIRTERNYAVASLGIGCVAMIATAIIMIWALA